MDRTARQSQDGASPVYNPIPKKRGLKVSTIEDSRNMTELQNSDNGDDDNHVAFNQISTFVEWGIRSVWKKGKISRSWKQAPLSVGDFLCLFVSPKGGQEVEILFQNWRTPSGLDAGRGSLPCCLKEMGTGGRQESGSISLGCVPTLDRVLVRGFIASSRFQPSSLTS